MSAVYSSLRRVLAAAVEIYFVDVQVTGAEHIPASGPVVLACNHPNSIMDPILLGTQVDRQVQFMAKSGLFSNPLVRAVFDAAGVIPVFRKQDHPTDTSKNQDSFRRAYDVLEAGGCIGIFPEGENTPNEDMVSDIKTGAARLALGAEALHDFGLGVQVVPVGLNFVDRDRFFSSVLIRVGPPIAAVSFKGDFAKDDRAAVRALTERLQADLRALAVHAADDQDRALLREVHSIYGKQLQKLLEGGRPRLDALDALRATSDEMENLDGRFTAMQAIQDALRHFRDVDPALVESVRRDVLEYGDRLKQVALKHEFLERNPRTLSIRREVLKLTMLATLWTLPSVYGLVHNAAPYFITKVIAERVHDEAKRAFVKFMVGAVAFAVFYGFYVWLALQFDAGWIARSLYFVSIPVAGFVTMRSLRQLRKYRDRMLMRVLFMTDRSMVQDLVVRRATLIERFDRLRERYVRETGRVW